jgi:hypothetical protein
VLATAADDMEFPRSVRHGDVPPCSARPRESHALAVQPSGVRVRPLSESLVRDSRQAPVCFSDRAHCVPTACPAQGFTEGTRRYRGLPSSTTNTQVRAGWASSHGLSTEAQHQLPKLNTRVRFPSSAPPSSALIDAVDLCSGLDWHDHKISASARHREFLPSRGALKPRAERI